MVLAADLDDATGEEIGAVADLLRDSTALDVTLLHTQMKKGRPGVRIEVLCMPADANALAALLLRESTTIGVRSYPVDRVALPRELHEVQVFGQPVGLKVVTLPDGTTRAKPEFDDVRRAAAATGRTLGEVAQAATDAAPK